MKKVFFIIAMILYSISYCQATESEFKSDFLNTFHVMCMAEQDTKTLANQLKTTPENICTCMQEQVSVLIDKSKIEQRLVNGDLSEEQFEKEMASYGEKAGDFCEKKYLP